MSKYKIVKTAVVCLAGLILVSLVDVIYDTIAVGSDRDGPRKGRMKEGWGESPQWGTGADCLVGCRKAEHLYLCIPESQFLLQFRM